jgi:hypothetical protein
VIHAHRHAGDLEILRRLVDPALKVLLLDGHGALLVFSSIMRLAGAGRPSSVRVAEFDRSLG